MIRLSVILSAVAGVSLLTFGGCATKDDIEALRSDIAARHGTGTTPAGTDLGTLQSDIAALRASIESADAARARGSTAIRADVKALRSDIAALRASLDATGAAPAATGTTTTGAVAAKGPPPADYRQVSTLVKLPAFIPGLGSLYVRPQTLPPGPVLAYDRDNRLVSTIYMIPVSDITARKRFEQLAVGDPAVQEVDVYFNPGHPGVEEPHYHVVLWHVPKESAKLQ
jgi:hypothetical protein